MVWRKSALLRKGDALGRGRTVATGWAWCGTKKNTRQRRQLRGQHFGGGQPPWEDKEATGIGRRVTQDVVDVPGHLCHQPSAGLAGVKTESNRRNRKGPRGQMVAMLAWVLPRCSRGYDEGANRAPLLGGALPLL